MRTGTPLGCQEPQGQPKQKPSLQTHRATLVPRPHTTAKPQPQPEASTLPSPVVPS